MTLPICPQVLPVSICGVCVGPGGNNRGHERVQRGTACTAVHCTGRAGVCGSACVGSRRVLAGERFGVRLGDWPTALLR